MHTYIHIDKNLFSHVFLRLVFLDHTFGVKHHFFDLSLKLFNPFFLFAFIASLRPLPKKKKKKPFTRSTFCTMHNSTKWIRSWGLGSRQDTFKRVMHPYIFSLALQCTPPPQNHTSQQSDSSTHVGCCYVPRLHHPTSLNRTQPHAHPHA